MATRKDDIDRALLMAAAADAREDVNAFAEFCIDDDKTPGLSIRQGWAHRQIQSAIPQLGERGNSVILCHREMGKCIASGSLVRMADGSTSKIEDISVGDSVLSVGCDWKAVANVVENVFHTGSKECLRIKLSSLREIVCSKGHRFMTVYGWVEAHQLVERSKVAVVQQCELCEIAWEEIAEIEYVGQVETHDLQVSKDHNYIANGILVHNSVQTAIVRTLWELGRNPELRVKIVTASDGLATKTVMSIKQHIESNWRLKLVFPELKPQDGGTWASHALTVARTSKARDCSVESFGVESAAAGGRADLLILDDIVDWRNAIKHPSLRELVKGVYREVWSNILANDGREVFCGTIYHSDDLCSELMNDTTGLYTKVVLPVVWTTELANQHGRPKSIVGTPVWSERWTKEDVEFRLKKNGRRVFERQFMLQALPGEDRIFSNSAIANSKLESYDFATWDQPGSPVSVDWPRYMGVDLASSLRKKSSYTVMFTIAVDPETRRRYPLNIVRRRMKFPETIRMIVAQYDRFRHTKILVENNAYQDAVISDISEEYKDIPLSGQMTGANKWDEDSGLPGLAVKMENGAWVIPWRGGKSLHEDTLGHDCDICSWVRELEQAPFGSFTDILMAMWLADCAAGSRKKKNVHTPLLMSRRWVLEENEVDQ